MSVEEKFYLMKGIPLPVIITMIIQTVTIVYFLADLRGDTDYNTQAILDESARRVALELVVKEQGRDSQEQAIALARIEEGIKNILSQLEENKK